MKHHFHLVELQVAEHRISFLFSPRVGMNRVSWGFPQLAELLRPANTPAIVIVALGSEGLAKKGPLCRIVDCAGDPRGSLISSLATNKGIAASIRKVVKLFNDV